MADVLRKVIAWGSRYHSPELRDWASRELNGYGKDDQLPDNRMIRAPIQLDGVLSLGGSIRGRPVSVMELPEFARDEMGEPMPLTHGSGEIERLAKDTDHIQLQDHSMQILVSYMNKVGALKGGQVMSLYWSVHPTALAGVVDRVRTALVALVAELSASIPPGADVPALEFAASSVPFIVTGKRNKVNFVASQNGSSMQTVAPDEGRNWWKVAGGVIGGLVTIGGALFA